MEGKPRQCQWLIFYVPTNISINLCIKSSLAHSPAELYLVPQNEHNISFEGECTFHNVMLSFLFDNSRKTCRRNCDATWGISLGENGFL